MGYTYWDYNQLDHVLCKLWDVIHDLQNINTNELIKIDSGSPFI